MTLQSVKEYLYKRNSTITILEYEGSSATVEQAAAVLGVEPAHIAKTLSFKVGEEAILIVTAGDAKIDNGKFKRFFGVKAKMLTTEEVVHYTSHPIGGVCPFGLAVPMKIYLDVSMKRFDYIYPAAGSISSAVKLTCNELYSYVDDAQWVDLCKGWQEDETYAHTI